MKRFLVAALVLVLVMGLAGCGSGGNATAPEKPAGGSGSSSSGSSSSDEITTVEALKAAIDKDYADASWYGDLKDISVGTYLGAQVLVLHVGWNTISDDPTAQMTKVTDLQSAIGALAPRIAPNVATVDADGAFSRLSSSSILDAAPMNTSLSVPAAPTTAAEVKSWLAAVYGPGGLVKLGPDETWYTSIKSVEMDDIGLDTPSLTVKTSLSQTKDRTQWDLLCFAVQSSGSPLLENWAVVSTTDSSILSGYAPASEAGSMGLYY